MPLPKTEFETSASYMAATGKALQKLQRFDSVVSQLGDASRARCLTSPYELRWWGAQASIDATVATAQVGGRELVRHVGRLAVFESMSIIFRPLISVLIAVSGSSPEAIFSRYQQFADTATRNIFLEYQRRAVNSGTLTIDYQCAVPANMPSCGRAPLTLFLMRPKRPPIQPRSRSTGLGLSLS
jgi:hypothetical protein